MIPRLWDIQIGENWWISLGFHLDHTDPSITLHLPGVVICIGRCKQPGFTRRPAARVVEEGISRVSPLRYLRQPVGRLKPRGGGGLPCWLLVIMASRTTAMTVRCPNCAAKPGERCLLSRPSWRGNIFRVAMHRERHNVLTGSTSKRRNSLARGKGWPNELQARQKVSDEAQRVGKAKLAEALGISQRYLRMILYNERPPTHQAILAYFGWPRIYEVLPEDDV